MQSGNFGNPDTAGAKPHFDNPADHSILLTEPDRKETAHGAQFVQLFETLLEYSYAGVIESYNNEKIVYLNETVKGDYAEVNSKVVTAKRDDFSIDYRLMNKGGKWAIQRGGKPRRQLQEPI